MRRSVWKENLEVLFGSHSVTKSASKDNCWQRKEKIEIRSLKIVKIRLNFKVISVF